MCLRSAFGIVDTAVETTHEVCVFPPITAGTGACTTRAPRHWLQANWYPTPTPTPTAVDVTYAGLCTGTRCNSSTPRHPLPLWYVLQLFAGNDDGRVQLTPWMSPHHPSSASTYHHELASFHGTVARTQVFLCVPALVEAPKREVGCVRTKPEPPAQQKKDLAKFCNFLILVFTRNS